MKKIYRSIVKKVSKLYEYFYIIKVGIAEWVAITKKRQLYNDVRLNVNDIKQVDDLWVPFYGKRISKSWHRLYVSINHEFKYDYFPDHIFSTRLEPKLNPITIAKFYSDKSLTEILYKGVKDVKFPETVVVNCSGIYYSKTRKLINEDEALSLLIQLNEFIIKPTIGGSSGQSVQLINLVNKNQHEKNKVIKSILDQYNENYIIQMRLQPHQSFRTLYPHSINTIRLITYILENEVCHAPLSLRMGIKGNKVDNIHAGGIVVGLSDDGNLRKYGYELGYCDSKIRYEKHPDTQIVFENYKVPEIRRMIQIAKDLHLNTPHLGMVSWDFMIDDIGDVILVEGNYFGQSIWFPQIVNGAPIFGENTPKFISMCNGNTAKMMNQRRVE